MRSERRLPRGGSPKPLRAMLRTMSRGCVDLAWPDNKISTLYASIRVICRMVGLYRHAACQAGGRYSCLQDGSSGCSKVCSAPSSFASVYSKMDPHIVFRNKSTSSPSRRLFLAFYPKAGSVPDEKTHTALLLAPAIPSTELNDTIRYHICISRGSGWDYQRDEVQARTPQLAAAVFVAEVPAHVAEAEIARIMQAVPIRHCDPNWSCYHWACSALLHLQQANLIDGLPAGDPMQLWKHGLEFCRTRHANAQNIDGDIPVCDASGRSLTAMF